MASQSAQPQEADDHLDPQFKFEMEINAFKDALTVLIDWNKGELEGMKTQLEANSDEHEGDPVPYAIAACKTILKFLVEERFGDGPLDEMMTPGEFSELCGGFDQVDDRGAPGMQMPINAVWSWSQMKRKAAAMESISKGP